MRPSSVLTAHRSRTLLLALGVLGFIAAILVPPVEARSEPEPELGRCDFDPRFGGSVANRVDHGEAFPVNVGNPVFDADGRTYASFHQLIFGDDLPLGSSRLSIIRWGADGKMDRAYGDNGFAYLPVAGIVVSMALVDGGIVALMSQFSGGSEAAIARLTYSGQLDVDFGANGIASLGPRGKAIDGELAGVVGPGKTDVFSYERATSMLLHLEVDHQGQVRELSATGLQPGSIFASYLDPRGRILIVGNSPEEAVDGELQDVTSSLDLGNGVTLVQTSLYPVGRGETEVWLRGSADGGTGRTLSLVDFDGNVVGSSSVNLRAAQSYQPVDVVRTLPSGEILVLDRVLDAGPTGIVYRFPNFESLERGEFTTSVIDLNKSASNPPPTELLVDLTGGVRVFSGAWWSSVDEVSQARLLPHPVAVPEAGATADQVQRLYRAAFNRAPDNPGLGYWLDQRAAGLPIVSVADLFVQSAEFRSIYASPDEAAFVEILYRNVLNRHSDSEGLAYWTGRLTSGDLTRAQVLLAFSDSPELVESSSSLAPNNSSWTGLSRLYETALDRPADVEGFCYFVAEMQDGQPLSWVAQQMLVSPEFTARHDGTDASVVAALYQGALNRSPSETELGYWVSQLSSGTSRTALLLHIANSPEALRKLGY